MLTSCLIQILLSAMTSAARMEYTRLEARHSAFIDECDSDWVWIDSIDYELAFWQLE
jgi:hypothetical protein